MSKATEEAVSFLKENGFSHIKFELEGDLGRDGDRYCDECNGDGHITCNTCDGDGSVEAEESGELGESEYIDCDDCYGEGTETCNYCDGGGYSGNTYDEEECESIMRNWVEANHPEAYQALNYGSFYEDGSVDSEFTFTIPIERVLTGDFQIWVKAFKHLADEVGNSIEVGGAGMHITLLQNGNYRNRTRLNSEGMQNFTREVTKLLPALFFVASAGHQSRGLSYRRPQISSSEKYSAIYTHDHYCIEYRLFETCYDRPDAINDYVQAIANTIKFYVDPSLKVKEVGANFVFPEGSECARFFNHPDQLRVLNQTYKYVKPKDKTYKKLREERGIKYTLKALEVERKKLEAQYRKDYAQYVKHWQKANTDPLNDDEQREVDWMMTDMGYTLDKARASVRGVKATLISLEDYLRDNMPRQARLRGEYSLAV